MNDMAAVKLNARGLAQPFSVADYAVIISLSPKSQIRCFFYTCLIKARKALLLVFEAAAAVAAS